MEHPRNNFVDDGVLETVKAPVVPEVKEEPSVVVATEENKTE